MESANLGHQRQLPVPDHLLGSPAAATAPSCYGSFGSSHAYAWTSSSSSSNSNISSTAFTTFGNSNPNYDDGSFLSNSSILGESTKQIKSHDDINNIDLVSGDDHQSLNNMTCTSTSSINMGFPWSNAAAQSQTASYDNNMQLSKIKEELSESFPKFTDILNSNIDDYGHFLLTTTTNTSGHLLKNEHHRDLFNNINNNGHHHRHRYQITSSSSSADPDFDESNTNTSTNCSLLSSFGGVGCKGQFSQIYPSINVSNLNQTSSSSSASNNSLGINSCVSQPSLNDINLGIFRDCRFGLEDHHHQMQQPHSLSSSYCGAHGKRISSFNSSEMTEAKRASSLMEPKTTQSKKTRLDQSRTSCPPFKIRKEKLGDRIAALQQLVSPFGKTDTASVLMEAIGYIKFLQNQVETLSVPYMKSSRSKSSKTIQRAGVKDDGSDQEPQRDLKSRGLCLVPLSCMSYVTGDGGGGSIWPPPNFGGRT